MSHAPAHLALLLPSLAAGGVGRAMLALARAFAARGHRVDLVLCRATGAYLDQVPLDVRVIALEAEGALHARLRVARLDPDGIGAALRPALLALAPAPAQPYLRDLARYLRAQRPTALLAAKTHTNVLALWGRALAGTPTRVVLSEHTQLSQSIARSRKWRWRHVAALVARTYPQADAIVAVSDGVADDLARTGGLARETVTTIYNPVVTPALTAQAAETPPHSWLEESNSPPVIVAVGRLVPQKNFALLLRAFARLLEQRPARLLILGEGRERARLEALAEKLDIRDHVALPGFVTNPYAAFARAALFVLSSDWEGLPTVLIEALACGCPVVSTDCPSGPAEILADGRYGPLVPVGDATALAGAMMRALDCPPPREVLRQRAAEFSLERSAARYIELLLAGAAGVLSEGIPSTPRQALEAP